MKYLGTSNIELQFTYYLRQEIPWEKLNSEIHKDQIRLTSYRLIKGQLHGGIEMSWHQKILQGHPAGSVPLLKYAANPVPPFQNVHINSLRKNMCILCGCIRGRVQERELRIAKKKISKDRHRPEFGVPASFLYVVQSRECPFKCKPVPSTATCVFLLAATQGSLLHKQTIF